MFYLHDSIASNDEVKKYNVIKYDHTIALDVFLSLPSIRRKMRWTNIPKFQIVFNQIKFVFELF